MEKPNVVVIMTDQMKANALHLYGNEFCIAPNLQRLADVGVLYENAFTPHPLCVPARISFWTSQYPHQHGCRRNQTLIKKDAIHAFKIWKKNGYHTAMIGKNHCFMDDDYEHTFDTWCELGHMNIEEKRKNKGMDWVRPVEKIKEVYDEAGKIKKKEMNISCIFSDCDPEDHSTGVVGRQTIKFLEDHKDEPFSLWVSFPCPHEPYIVPEKYARLFSRDKIKLPPWNRERFLKNIPERSRIIYEMLCVEDETDRLYDVMAAYYGNIVFIDEMVGKIMDKLDELHIRGNTIMVFCSDHGDFMGEYRMTVKGGAFYDCLTKVPLILSWPGGIEGGIIDKSIVSLIDVVPTLLKLQGIDIPEGMIGELLPTITEACPRDIAFSEYGAGMQLLEMEEFKKVLEYSGGYEAIFETLLWREAEGRRKMVRTHQWKYVHDPMGDMDELYNLVEDPWEQENIIDDPKYKETVNVLRLKLLDWCIKTEDASYVQLPPAKFLKGSFE